MRRKDLPELLAPCGSMEALHSAVHAGCDAVYFGGQRFNARQGGLSGQGSSKGGFDEDEIREAVRYCRLYGVKTLLTVNTIVKESEWADFQEDFDRMAACGITGVIVQDMGVAEYIHSHYPTIELHASTQMSIHTLEGARFLEKLGFTRVVLARELTLEEVRTIRQGTNIELEVFIHGAMCYSVSGQCLLSSLIGGRSGNRGMCAQPCRLPYQLEGGRTGFLMNMKDMCTLEILQDLIALGVNSFKIEGRLKSPEYVYGVTRSYRLAMDGRLSEADLQQEVRNLKQLFNRGGFSKGGWIPSTHGIESGSPKHQGLKVGTVTAIQGGRIRIQSQEILHPKDVLEIRTAKQPYPSYQLQNRNLEGDHECWITAEVPVRKGMEVYRLRDEELMESYQNPEAPVIAAEGRFTLFPGVPARLSVKTERGAVEVEGTVPEPATGTGLTEETIRKAMMKTGGTVFSFTHLDIAMAEGLFLPVSALNALRRDALDQLAKCLSAAPLHEKQVVEERKDRSEETVDPSRFEAVVSTAEQWKALANVPGVKVFFRTERFSLEELQAMMEEAIERDIACGLALPYYQPGAVSDSIVKLVKTLGCQEVLARNPGQIEALQEIEGLQTHLDLTIPVCNQTAASFWKTQADTITLSCELTHQEMKQLPGPGRAVMVYGKIPAMISKQCMKREGDRCLHGKQPSLTRIQDRMQVAWDLEMHCPSCYTVLYTGHPVWMADRSKVLKELPAEALRLYFLDETGEQTRFVMQQYQQALQGLPVQEPGFATERGHFFQPCL